MSLDEKLINILLGEYDPETDMLDMRQLQIKRIQPKLEAIKAAFTEETGLTKLMQDMVNLQANMKQDMLRLGLTPTPEKHESEDYNRMTGQEWYDRFSAEMSKVTDMWLDQGNGFIEMRVLRKAARKASNLDA